MCHVYFIAKKGDNMPSYDEIIKAVHDTSQAMGDFDITNHTDEDLNKLSNHVDVLADLNSSFPVVQSFLSIRGLTHINQLDDKGHEELLAFLEDILTSIKETK